MSKYLNEIQSISNEYNQQEKIKQKVVSLMVEYREGIDDFKDLIDASRMLVTLTDLNTKKVTTFIEGIINKALMEMYPSGEYYIKVQKSFFRKTPSIEVLLYDNDNHTSENQSLDLNDQAGDGISRIISFIFSLSIIELCGARKFVALDEVLTGFHSDSLIVIKNVINIFKRGGFQFIASEYDINDMGIIYKGTKEGTDIDMKELGMAEDVQYDRELI